MLYKKKITWTTCYENMLTMAKMKIGELKGGGYGEVYPLKSSGPTL